LRSLLLRVVLNKSSNSMSTEAKPQAELYNWANTTGEFVRQVSSFRNWITKDGPFKAEPNRYHLYVSFACPWAHRTLIGRAMKGLEEVIGVTVVDYLLGPDGWKFTEPEPINGCRFLREIYFKAEPNYSGRFTVPVLWDKVNHTIVSNESSEILRMTNSEFNHLSTHPKLDLYPEAQRAQIDQLNEWVYDCINNGVYKAGFATAQGPYELNCHKVFDGLDRVEAILGSTTYLMGSHLTEADVRLFTTLVRFDPVYHGHFKCNLRQISTSYPKILNWLRRIFQTDGVAPTVNMEHIKKHYYMSHIQINPTRVVPLSNGPDLSLPFD